MSGLDEVTAAADPALAEYAAPDPPPGRFAGQQELPLDRAFVLEAVHEGYLAHYAEPRAFAGMDPDLALLAGDALYALGLERLAEAGDLEAVATLSELIATCAQAQAEGRTGDIAALWDDGARKLAD